MILIGSGSLMSKILKISLDLGYPVEAGITGIADNCTSFFKRNNISIIESPDLDKSLFDYLQKSTQNLDLPIVIFINNNKIINDKTLMLGANFYNFHFGLTQKYRGIAEICIISAIINNESEYGVTLHKVLPGEKVDKGPIVSQSSFPLFSSSTFSSVMESCIDSMFKIYTAMIPKLISKDYASIENVWISPALTYGDLPKLISLSTPEQIKRYQEFGKYEVFLPKLSSLLQSQIREKKVITRMDRESQ